ncbi:MAG: long-chain fatty acid--CoA ligase, partial [Pedosphaera parvula]|nr:long-chain fatty acid--CoA ligase [Pedosphaera parvula]
MLYERWGHIAADRRSDLALCDLASGRRWTFGELCAAAEARPLDGSDFVCPSGHSPEFILDVLAAWRMHRVVCPLEPSQTPPAGPLPPAPCVHLKTTSATTGAPRLIAFTAEQLAADAENILATMGLRPDWPNVGAISMAHPYGFSNLVLPLLLHGIPLILAPSPLPELVRQAIENQTCVTVPAVPALWRAWHEAGIISPKIRLGISAGAPLPLGLEEKVFQASGVKIHNFYGSSECGGIAYDASDAPRTDDAYVGAPMRNVVLSVRPDGCLSVRGRAVGETYWPESTTTLGAGHFHTADLVELRDGSVFLLGRLSDQINVAGRKVSPTTIEQVLLRHRAVRDCLVFGVTSLDPVRGESIVACVVAEPS